MSNNQQHGLNQGNQADDDEQSNNGPVHTTAGTPINLLTAGMPHPPVALPPIERPPPAVGPAETGVRPGHQPLAPPPSTNLLTASMPNAPTAMQSGSVPAGGLPTVGPAATGVRRGHRPLAPPQDTRHFTPPNPYGFPAPHTQFGPTVAPGQTPRSTNPYQEYQPPQLGTNPPWPPLGSAPAPRSPPARGSAQAQRSPPSRGSAPSPRGSASSPRTRRTHTPGGTQIPRPTDEVASTLSDETIARYAFYDEAWYAYLQAGNGPRNAWMLYMSMLRRKGLGDRKGDGSPRKGGGRGGDGSGGAGGVAV